MWSNVCLDEKKNSWPNEIFGVVLFIMLDDEVVPRIQTNVMKMKILRWIVWCENKSKGRVKACNNQKKENSWIWSRHVKQRLEYMRFYSVLQQYVPKGLAFDILLRISFSFSLYFYLCFYFPNRQGPFVPCLFSFLCLFVNRWKIYYVWSPLRILLSWTYSSAWFDAEVAWAEAQELDLDSCSYV